jgi:hypothetical protein
MVVEEEKIKLKFFTRAHIFTINLILRLNFRQGEDITFKL